MTSIRSQAIAAITTSAQPIDPVDQLVLAATHDVTEWFNIAYPGLCSRDKPITWAEGERLGAKTVAFIAEAREKLRDEKLNSLGARAKFDASDAENTLINMVWPSHPEVTTPISERSTTGDLLSWPPSPTLVSKAEFRSTPTAPAASEQEASFSLPLPPEDPNLEPRQASPTNNGEFRNNSVDQSSSTVNPDDPFLERLPKKKKKLKGRKKVYK